MPGVVHFFTGLFSNVFGHRKRNFLKVLKPFCKLPHFVVWVAKNELVDVTASSSTTAAAATTV